MVYEFETSKHAQLIGWFNKNFIHPEKIEPEYGKMINKAFNRRTKGDYDVYVDFDKDVVSEMFDEMKSFIARIKKHLEIS
ncbi:HEPN domain-containing protein [Marinilabilia salmonicolor]|uniref:HEPN domain-containing protein n=1 Tax=Marinilabilia salmonicolor TaxID=989 RepID=A0A2T0XP02_9BACT|nr:HEPN domain-containing protein [Marinilabilia salmonicolor]PRZ00656.1 HEPN domain-containing protein [Marinilabilia salmonicolor]RCW30831.1 HEPN domain-containing protein [Marinilabilia salmonicolor]